MAAEPQEHTSDFCPLCRLVEKREIITKLHYEDDLIMVVDCMICGVPMAVLKGHRRSYSDAEKEHVRAFLQTIGTRGAVIDWEQRNIPDHAHCHLRPHPFPFKTNWELLFPK